jgi:hypothetical protein
MTGLPDLNYPAFEAAAAWLRQHGYEVVCPTENGLPADATWNEHMRVDLRMLLDCSGIVLLPGWRKSKGARLEYHNAKELGMRIEPYVVVRARHQP